MLLVELAWASVITFLYNAECKFSSQFQGGGYRKDQARLFTEVHSMRTGYTVTN